MSPLGASSEPHQKCSSWAGSCVACGKDREWTRGIFCATFYWSMKGYAPCQQMWCSVCYTLSLSVLFHVKTRAKEEAKRENDPELQQRLRSIWGKKHHSPDDFRMGLDGDHLMVPFECDLCVFRKLNGRNPILASDQDNLLSTCIRRAPLDSRCWRRLACLAPTSQMTLSQRQITAGMKSQLKCFFTLDRRDSNQMPTCNLIRLEN